MTNTLRLPPLVLIGARSSPFPDYMFFSGDQQVHHLVLLPWLVRQNGDF